MTNTLKTIVFALAACWSLILPLAVASGGYSSEIGGRASVEVRSDVGWIGPGQTFNIVVVISPEPEWHVYWKNPGASGAPTEIEVSAPKGFKVGEPLFPRPEIIQTIDGPTYGYNKLVAIFIPVTAPESFENESVTFEIITMWLACKKVCVLGENETKLRISTNTNSDGPQHKDMRLSQWKKRLPRPLKDLKDGNCRIEGNVLIISGWSDGQVVSFIGLEQRGIRFNNHTTDVTNEGKFSLNVLLALDFSATDKEIIEVEGLLLLGRNSNDPSYVVRANATAQK
jgi:DsbC/DsbD-like thiol-disulfide interchange protein